MVIVQLLGRLGNQMFQYALYRSLLMRGKQAKISEMWVVRDYGWGLIPRLTGTFVGDYAYATIAEIEPRVRFDIKRDRMLGPVKRATHRPIARLTGRGGLYREDKQDLSFDPKVFSLEDAYLVGYWQSEKYFDLPGMRERLQKDFTLRENWFENKAFTEKLAEIILEEKAVAVHVRRTDYMNSENLAMFGGVCGEGYYQRALRMMRERVPGAVFYIFSDDPAYTKAHFTDPDCRVVSGFRDIHDLELMRNCRHFVMANSSFSWWAAYLGYREDSVVLAPDVWLRGRKTDDIWSDWMERIPCDG